MDLLVRRGFVTRVGAVEGEQAQLKYLQFTVAWAEEEDNLPPPVPGAAAAQDFFDQVRFSLFRNSRRVARLAKVKCEEDLKVDGGSGHAGPSVPSAAGGRARRSRLTAQGQGAPATWPLMRRESLWVS